MSVDLARKERLVREVASPRQLDIPESDEKVSVTIDGTRFDVNEGLSIYDAAASKGIYIPVLCHHPSLPPAGKCRVCAVEVEGDDDFQLACCTQVKQDMVIKTKTPAVRSAAIAALRTMQENQFNTEDLSKAETEFERLCIAADHMCADHNFAIKMDTSSCVDCSRCVRTCSQIQDMNILKMAATQNGSQERSVASLACDGLTIDETGCIACGQCTTMCPVDAITEVDDIPKVREAKKLGKTMVVQTAPAVRVAIGEECGLEAGEISTGKMVAALRRLGFDYVFDTNFTADLTILEEGNELIKRIKDNILAPTEGAAPLPMFTSCCPAWVNYVEKRRPDVIPHLSSCKSPMGMLGALIKEWWPGQAGIPREQIYSCAIMPCTAKKQECMRPQLGEDYAPHLDQHIDNVLTTRELGRMIREANIDFASLPDEPYDRLFGASSGAAVIFGASGGVMEAALRTAYEVLTEEKLPRVEFEACRGLKGLREADIDIPIKGVGNVTLKIAVCSNIAVAKKLLKGKEAKDLPYHFIEVMACPGGCIGGGGQPRSIDPCIVRKRQRAIYTADETSAIRRSHENPEVMKLYEEFLEEPLSHHSHHLLHTHYTDKTGQVMDVKPAVEIPAGGSDAILIVYATQTGTTGGFANTVARKIRGGGVDVEVYSASDMPAGALVGYQRIIYMTCTYGMGEHPAMGKGFYDDLLALDEGFLDGKKVSIFGIGSTAYGDNFNKAGSQIETAFARLGVEFITKRGIADEKAEGGFDTEFNVWCDSLLEALGVEEAIGVAPPAPSYRVILAHGSGSPRVLPYDLVWVPMIANRRLTPEDYSVDTRYIEFDLRDTGLTYKTGYHIAIHPANTEERVTDFLDYYGLDGRLMISVEPVGNNPRIDHLDQPMSIRELFTSYLDIYDLVRRDFFRRLAPFATDPQQRARLIHLGSKEGAEDLAELIKNEGYNYVDALKEFNTAKPGLHHLVDMIPIMKPRLYSIASSHRSNPMNLELIFGVVEHWTKSGKVVLGRTGAYFLECAEKLARGETVLVPCAIHSSPLTPPEPHVPVVVAGLGTGIAPFRGFAQDRHYLRQHSENPEEIGDMVVLYGCRYRAKDYVIADEWDNWEKDGSVIMRCAFSRDGPKKVYVQDKVREDLELFYDLMVTKEAKFCYCGPAGRVPAGIHDAFVRAVMEIGGKTEEEAETIVYSWSTQGRYVVESY